MKSKKRIVESDISNLYDKYSSDYPNATEAVSYYIYGDKEDNSISDAIKGRHGKPKDSSELSSFMLDYEYNYEDHMEDIEEFVTNWLDNDMEESRYMRENKKSKKRVMLENRLREAIRPIVRKMLKEQNEYYIMHHASDNYGPPKTIFKTDKFDQQVLQKKFDDFAKTMKEGDILEYGKSDSKRFHPSMLEVEMTKRGLVRTTPNGKTVKYVPKS